MSDPATPPASPAEPEDPLRIPPMHEVYNFARSNPQTFADIVYEVEVEWGREAMHGRLVATPPAPAATDEEVARMVERLTRADEYEPLGHDGWEAADLLARVARERDELQQLYMLVGEGRDLAQQRAEVAEKERDEAHRAYSELMRLREATSARLAEAEKALREMMNEAGTHTVAVGQQTGFARIWNLGQAYLAKHAGGDNG